MGSTQTPVKQGEQQQQQETQGSTQTPVKQ